MPSPPSRLLCLLLLLGGGAGCGGTTPLLGETGANGGDAGDASDEGAIQDAGAAGDGEGGASPDAGLCLLPGDRCGPGLSCGPGLFCAPGGDGGAPYCAGKQGAACLCATDCASGDCIGPHDCHAVDGCADVKKFCGQSTRNGPCSTNDDCSTGACQTPSPGVTPGACCSGVSGQCQADSDCCKGLLCATDNTGCRKGPTPGCVIDGVSYASNQPNPASPDCQYCDPYKSPGAWTNTGSYHPCGDGGTGGFIPDGSSYYCCAGACSNQVCAP